jgi:hypothetical protein
MATILLFRTRAQAIRGHRREPQPERRVHTSPDVAQVVNMSTEPAELTYPEAWRPFISLRPVKVQR